MIPARRLANPRSIHNRDRPRRDVDRIEALCSNAGKDLIDVLGSREIKHLPAEAENISRMIDLAALSFEVNGIYSFSGDKCQAGQSWQNLFQQPYAFGHEIECNRRDPGDVAFRVSKVIHDSALERIGCNRDNGNGRCSPHESANNGCRSTPEHVRPPRDQLSRECRSLLELTIS